MTEPIPAGSRLIHIGLAKTGTTALQSAFHHNRGVISEHGVHYAGPYRQAFDAAQDATRMSPADGRARTGAWPRLLAEVEATTAERVVISSEGFAHNDDLAANAVIEGLGRDRTHVVITMRPLADMLPSAWWQYVQQGAKTPFDAWLDRVLGDDLDHPTFTPSFWRRTRIDLIAERWAGEVGAENLTVVSLAERPRDFVLRAFEQLVALPEGVLVPDEGETNPSLPYVVAEVARHFNQVVRAEGGRGIDQVRRQRITAYNMLKGRPDLLSDTRRVETPAWAVERAGEVAAGMNARLRELGVNVAGDLDALTRPARPVSEIPMPAPDQIAITDAAALAYCMMRATERKTTEAVKARFARREQVLQQRITELETRAVDRTGGRDLLRELGSRARRRLRR